MRKSKFSEAQIVAIVRESEAEGVTVEQVSKKHGITATTLFRWRKRFGGLDPSQAAELRQLQTECRATSVACRRRSPSRPSICTRSATTC
jgi:putative transposase